MGSAIDYAKKIIAETGYLVVLTGAGISAESGIPTFRGKDGLWRNFRAEELATPGAFDRDPRLVWEWYNWRREIIRRARPNPAHRMIARLERVFPQFLLVTQNVDGLHSKAGNRKIAELHGNIWRMRCTLCGKVLYNTDVPLKVIPPLCGCGGILRPGVVWFGESLPQGEISRGYSGASQCDSLLVVGTSCMVYPAASIPKIAKERGAKIIEVNLQRTPVSEISDVSLLGKAGEILPKLIPNQSS